MNNFKLIPSKNSDERTNVTMSKFGRRISSVPPGACPLTVELALLQASAYQTCGKCVPCRDGLPHLATLLEKIVKCQGDESTYKNLISLAKTIRDTAGMMLPIRFSKVRRRFRRNMRAIYPGKHAPAKSGRKSRALLSVRLTWIFPDISR